MLNYFKMWNGKRQTAEGKGDFETGEFVMMRLWDDGKGRE